MDHIYRRPVQQGGLKVLNQKEDRDLQQKLNMLEKQYRYTRKMLQQRKDSLITEERRVVMVKVCEPKATVNIAMKEIEHKNEEIHFSRDVQTSVGRRLHSSERHDTGPVVVEQTRSTSAPPPSVRPLRHRGGIQSNVSFMQMKNIATIDSISEKELAREQQRAREEVERLRQLHREDLHERMRAFIKKLKEKSSMETAVEPP
ncbi:uncharacterized protein LOC114426976 [Parambassis ranga]|uniref:Uncharacterized protein LOC114426976 n=1 Tax=Parambassis ranga TaxID=210632 RepID=A0A6P7HIS1_9TELE|nr:uncharacterized protein LOC114426976 [Parambassis ranga]XP_028250442.1 uncharacterized protein LOC114426976 [Parambassis ranga]